MINISTTLNIFYLAVKNVPSLVGPAAYIDPNTGGMLFQVLAVLLGVFSGLLLFFSGRIKNLYYKIRRRMGKSNQADAPKKEQIESLHNKE